VHQVSDWCTSSPSTSISISKASTPTTGRLNPLNLPLVLKIVGEYTLDIAVSHPEMPLPVENHRFNDDLLFGGEDLHYAREKYPTIRHVLDDPELRRFFSEYNEPANRAKSRGRTYGYCAIALVFFGLGVAASEHLFKHGDGAIFRDWSTGLALLSAVCGIVGVVIGAIGILHAQKKRSWLHFRLMTERLRQFHFQTFIFRLPEILKSLKSEGSRAAFEQTRTAWLREFKAVFSQRLDSEFTNIVEDEKGANIWLHGARKEPVKIEESEQLEPLFEAYRELRIMHQIGYANYKLQDDPRLFADAPRTQAAVLSTAGLICIILLCAIHIFVLFAVVFASAKWEDFADAVSLVSIWLALLALALRAIEQGLQPEREIERYQQYRSALWAILDRFDLAPSQNEKIRIMWEMTFGLS
jgi:hypothetical protein